MAHMKNISQRIKKINHLIVHKKLNKFIKEVKYA